MNRGTPGLPVHHQLPKFTQTHVHQVSDAIQPSHPLSSPSSLAPNPSQHQSLFPISQLFTWGGQKYWSFSFSISPSKEIPGLISFRMDWLDLLAVQGTLKSLLQHHSSKASILRCSAFFTVQLSHPLQEKSYIWKRHIPISIVLWSSVVAQKVKRLPTMRRPRFDPCVGNIPWRRKWQPTPVFLPGKSHGQRSLVGYSPQGRQDWATSLSLSYTVIWMSLGNRLSERSWTWKYIISFTWNF